MLNRIFMFLFIMIVSVQGTAKAEEYIVKFRNDISVLLSKNEVELEPLLPDEGIYVTNNIEQIDNDLLEYIEPNYEVKLFDTYDYSEIIEEPEHSITGIRNMWEIGAYGKDIKIGVIDSGCNAYGELGSNLCVGYNMIDENEDTSDHIGHGTAVSGVIAVKYGFKTIIGTAPKAKIVPIKFMDKNTDGVITGGTTKQLAGAIIKAVDDFDCDIINLSCGTLDTQTLEYAVNYALSKGVTIVAAVGNAGTDEKNYPASYKGVIGVGSVGADKQHSEFSNVNDSVFICAPGENIDILDREDLSVNNYGTSFSAPYVSGIIADMLSIDPSLTPDTIKNIIKQSAEDLGEAGWDTKYGHGLIRADKITDLMLKGQYIYISDIDLCEVDNYYEIRLRAVDGAEIPQCYFVRYEDGILCDISSVFEKNDNNIYIIRICADDSSSYKAFFWDNKMKPIYEIKQIW